MDKTEINIFLTISFAIVFTMVAGLIYFISQFRKQKLQEEIQKLKSINIERERIIKDLHDEVGGSLSSLQLISNLILENHSKIDINKQLYKINTISQDVSQQIKMIVWSLDNQKDTLFNLIDFLKKFSNQFIENTKFQLEFIQNCKNDFPISGLIRKNIYLIVKESINNSIKHSKGAKIFIEIECKNDTIQFMIVDDGIGFVNESKFGNGLKNIEHRVLSINGKYNISHSEGTKIQFEIPLFS